MDGSVQVRSEAPSLRQPVEAAPELTAKQLRRLAFLRSLEDIALRTMDGRIYGYQQSPIHGFMSITEEDKALLEGRPVSAPLSPLEAFARRAEEEQAFQAKLAAIRAGRMS